MVHISFMSTLDIRNLYKLKYRDLFDFGYENESL